MADFLDFVRRRRLQLRKELNDLETAERVYLEAQSRGEVVVPPADLFQDIVAPVANSARALEQARAVPKNIQAMVLRILDDIYPAGMTALEILEQIQLHWKPDLTRTSLSPQLSRLKAARSIKSEKHKWYLQVQDDTGVSEVPNAPA
jgi:hypothetical protein